MTSISDLLFSSFYPIGEAEAKRGVRQLGQVSVDVWREVMMDGLFVMVFRTQHQDSSIDSVG